MKKCFRSIFILLLSAVTALTQPIMLSPSAEIVEPNTGADLYENGLTRTVEGGAILHCWCWSFNTIREKMPEIAAAGFSSIQTSPICEVNNGGDGSLTISGGDNWWWHYQPVDYKIGNYQLGTMEEFRLMCEVAHSYGIKVIVDSVLNHCSADYSKISNNVKNLAGESFHAMGDWNELDRYDMTQYDLSDLYDLNTQNKAVQNYLLSFLKTCVENGADGFRFDAAKHIELPDDSSSKHGSAFASDFWPTILQNGAVFQYGEILQEGGRHFYTNSRTGYDDNDSSRLSAYQSQTFTDQDGAVHHMNTTNSFTGHRIREAISTRNLRADYVADTLLPKNADAAMTVTWVESHDNYCNEASYQTLTDIQQVIQGWSLIAARRDGTPLFFDRPNNSTASNPWGDNKIGPEGSDMYKDPQVAAVNFFRNEMGATPQRMTNPIPGNTQVVMIERGDANKGAVIVNASDADVELSAATDMADGTYTDQAFKGTFTVSGGLLTGTVKAGKVAVVYDPLTDDSDKESFAPTVNLSPASGFFFTDTLEADVTVRGCDHAAYTLKIGDSIVTDTAVTGEIITIKSLENNQSAVLTLTGYDADGQAVATVTRTYTRWVKQNNTVVYMDPAARSAWKQCYVYIWGSSENKSWPGERAELTEDGLYRYVLPYQYEIPGSYGNVIFNNGSGQQFDAGRITPGQKMIYTADGKWTAYEEPVVTILGDADGDGKIDVFDASYIQKGLAGTSGYPDYGTLTGTSTAKKLADIDRDGKVDIFDASLIQKYIAGDTSAQYYGIGDPAA